MRFRALITTACAVAGAAGATLAVGCAPPTPVGESAAAVKVCAAGAVTPGVDVSHYQGTIDWARVHAAGIGFAIMKATEGLDYVDDTFAANWAGAAQNGVIRGAYHFFRPEDDPVAQADHFLAVAGAPARGDLPLALDLEVTDSQSAAVVSAGALKFVERLRQVSGRVPLVYTTPSFFTDSLAAPTGFGPYTLWIANWTTGCPIVPGPDWTGWTFWQSSNTGTVDGIAGKGSLDLDQFNGSLAQLQAFVDVGGPDGGADGGPADAGGADDAAPPAPAPPLDASVGPTVPVRTALVHGGCAMTGGATSADAAWLVLLLLAAASRARLRRA